MRDLADTSAAVAATRARSTKIGLLAECLRGLAPDEVAIAVAYLSGELRQRRTGVGYAALRDLPPPATDPTLTIHEVDETFAGIAALSGSGSSTERRRRFTELMAKASEPEQRLIAGLVSGDIRQGALGGLLTEAVALAADVPSPAIRRAVTLAGDLTPVAQSVLTDGAAGLAKFSLAVGTPLRPMLAQSAPSVADALTRAAPDGGLVAVEWKLDGIRVQVHRDGEDIAVYTRSLDEITSRVPEVVESVRALPVRSIVLDGEVLALDADERPRPFQETASRVSRRSDPEHGRRQTPLTPFFFDLLQADGADLSDAPGAQRWLELEQILPVTLRVPRLVTADSAVASEFLDDALARGHEGVLVKSLRAPYEAGRRGSGWVKVKPRHTLDLVVLAAEWGHGRRKGWLSNLHLGARDPNGSFGPAGGFVMLGKTFKGLTDQMLQWQTHRFQQLAVGGADHWVVQLRPEIVVEVAFDGVQTSPRYPAGVALRFARVLRYRSDKTADETDTVSDVLALRQG